MTRAFCTLLFGVSATIAAASHFPSPEDWRDENIYFIFTDRFYDGDPSNNNATPGAPYAPTNSRGIHGGDFKGIEQKVDYIKALGATAIWITPIPLNVAGSAYHGYGAKDFYRLAPHLGTLADLSNMVAACHSRGIKVILDVVVNHSGNLLDSGDAGYPTFRNPPDGYNLRYRNPAEQHAPPFNITNATPPAFTSLFHTNGVIQDFNNLIQVEKGELSNLDDFNTELVYVRTNMANIYKHWMKVADFDGFRVDTVKHVEHGNGGFWNYWCPEIRNFATSIGKSNFFLFGEVYDGSDQKCGFYTGTRLSTNFAFDAVLDYPLYFMIGPVFASATANTKQIEDHYNAIAAYYDPAAHYRLVTFLDNHDQRRFLNINSSTNRLAVALTFLYTARGIPCLYYGTEQAFNGSTDPNNREDMFDGAFEQGPSLGDNFNMTHPLFRHVAFLNNLRRNYPALRRGGHRNLWNNPDGPGLFAYARTNANQELFIVFNTAASAQTLPARPTTYPPGTVLVNLFNTNETLTVTAASEIPALNVPSTSAKIFVARNQFVPLDPVVLSQSPAHGATNISPTAAVVLGFSKPMDTNSVEAAFSVNNRPGTFTWNSLRNTMTFTPAAPLPGTTNIVRLATTAADSTDGKTLFAPFETWFVTSGTPPADTTPPAIAITAPAEGAIVTGTLNVTGTATDNIGVSRVEARLDNGDWTVASGTATWSLSLNSANFLNGSHTIAARAFDAAGNVSTTATRLVKFFNQPGDYLVRISAGNPTSVTDCSSNIWVADQPYTLGSFGYSGGTTGFIANAITNVCPAEYPLYQRERYSTPAGSFRYLFDCPEGIYETTLLFAETWTNAPNGRVFHVFIEAEQVLTNFDIFVAAGGSNIALTRIFTNAVADSQLEIQFFPLIDNARAGGIAVRKVADIDTDADGIPDWWTLAYFDHPTGQAGDLSRAGDDPDGDGRNNLQEFLEGTNPLAVDSPPQPAAPSDLTATPVFENQIQLAWRDNSTNEQFFIIQRSSNGGAPWTQAGSVNAGVTNFFDCTVAGGLSYSYRVLATNSFGPSAPSNIATATTPPTAAFVAFDRASDPAYAGGWPDQSNGGFGFGAWRLLRSSTNSSLNGFFGGSSTNNGPKGGIGIDSCGKAFGLYANSGNHAVACRALLTPLLAGQSFRWRIDNGWIDPGQTVGIVLRTGNATNSTANYNTGARFEFLFQGGTNNYHVVDAAGRRDTGVGYSHEALELQFNLTGPDSYSLRIARLASHTTNTLSGTLGGSAGSSIESFALYNRNAGAGPAFDVFFNSFRQVNLDSVGDGIPDWWRANHFPQLDPSGASTNSVSCAGCDPDGDGTTNYNEFIAGTVPTDAGSAFRITAITVTGNDVAVSWTTVPGKTYRLQRCDSPDCPLWTDVGTQRTGTGGIVTETDAGAASITPRYYRVRLNP